MLTLATSMIGLAATVGVILAIQSARAGGAVPTPAWFAAVHGLLELGGWVVLLVALRGPTRGARTGTEPFGTIAAILLGVAAMVGIALFASRARRRGGRGGLIGVHASFAVCGFVILAVYALLA